MRKVSWATPLYKFLKYCNDSPLEKTVIDCGAGGGDPPLQLFREYGYRTFGVEVEEDPFNKAKKFCNESGMKLNILKADMRHLPFKNAAFSFAYSFNAISFMAKKDITISVREIERVLKPNGLCFVNFDSIDDPNKRPFCKPFLENPRFSKHEDNEAEKYFKNFEIIHKEKRIINKKTDGERSSQAYIDYIARKMD